MAGGEWLGRKDKRGRKTCKLEVDNKKEVAKVRGGRTSRKINERRFKGGHSTRESYFLKMFKSRFKQINMCFPQEFCSKPQRFVQTDTAGKPATCKWINFSKINLSSCKVRVLGAGVIRMNLILVLVTSAGIHQLVSEVRHYLPPLEFIPPSN